MKFIFALMIMLPGVVMAAPLSGRDPRLDRVGVTSMVNSSLAPAPNRAGIASKSQLTTPDISISVDRSPSIKEEPGIPAAPKVKDTRDSERAACIDNNVGIGNTFVWASRYSNTANYATMQEDTENPENNVCFVRVDLKSTDARIDMSGMNSKYFQMGELLTCGSWVDEEILKQRILDAKKTGRTLATVGGAVGGAAIGVGSMELFGNRLIGGKVEGQKNKKLSDTDVLRSQLLTMKKNNDSRYTTFMNDLRDLKKHCDDLKKAGGTNDKCDAFNFDVLLSL